MSKFLFAMTLTLCLLGPSVAHAEFLFTFDSDTLQGHPGDTLTFIATILNENATETLTLDSGGISSLDAGLTQHPGDTLFVDNFLLPSNLTPLAPNGNAGDRIEDAIARIDIDAGVTPNTTLLGTFDVTGHNDGDPPGTLAPTGPTFRVEVLPVATIPEPGSLALVASLLVPAAAVLYCRRKRSG